MKLQLIGHDERYVVEQSLMALFPGELPEYAAHRPGGHGLGRHRAGADCGAGPCAGGADLAGQDRQNVRGLHPRGNGL